MSRRHDYYSLNEANAAIPTLEYYFRELLLIQRNMAELQQLLLAHGATVGAEGVVLPRRAGAALERARDQYVRLCADYDHVMQQILGLGIEVVDPEVGIVNFYTWTDGEEVIFSWQYGEPAIQFWHDPGEQFHDRRPLRQLMADVPGSHARHH